MWTPFASRRRSALDRFSKPHGHGDVSGKGLGRLMGATNLTVVELLVRETIQNSWDARLPGARPEYGAIASFLTPTQLESLREEVFADLPPSSPLETSLSQRALAGVEIFDRGTKGLDGPLDPRSDAVDSTRSNFVKLVFDIGSTKAAGQGSAGTYGFGKTAAFTAGESKSVVYWSACEDEYGEVEHRLIGVCHGHEYTHADARFTGVHWWGRTAEDGTIWPVVGAEARRLGEKLFSRRFEDGETGTSVLVLDPLVAHRPALDSGESDGTEYEGSSVVRSRGQLTELRRQVAEAASKFAWPKLTAPSEGEHPPMAFHVGGRDDPDPDEIAGGPDLTAYKTTLNVLRQFQAQGDKATWNENRQVDGGLLDIQCRAIRVRHGGRNVRVGDLAVARRYNLTADAPEHSGSWTVNHLCNMRHDAELVVEYIPRNEIDATAWTWFAVFKPRPEYDDHFAAAEPPAHDAWRPGAGMPEDAHYTVTRVQTNVTARLRDILRTRRDVAQVSGHSTLRVANKLRSLVPIETAEDSGAPGSRAGGTTRSGKSAGGARSRNLAYVDSAHPGEALGGRQNYAIRLKTAGSGGSDVQVALEIRARTAQGTDELEHQDIRIDASSRAAHVDGAKASFVMPPGEAEDLSVQVPEGVALSVDVTGEAVDADGG